MYPATPAKIAISMFKGVWNADLREKVKISIELMLRINIPVLDSVKRIIKVR